MAYSTGSGTYTALMAAVLAHAIADGWTEIGGLGTGWPITKGNMRGVDFTTYTASENDVTAGGDGSPKTQRYMRLGIGTDGPTATTNAGATTTICPNFAYTFSAWHIFSEPALNDHIHVVVQFSNGPNADVFGHFSFGEIDKGGLTYNSIEYATCSGHRGYAVTSASGQTGSSDWNSMNETINSFSGNVGNADFNVGSGAAMSFIINATTAPTPNGTAGWPAWDTLIEDGDSMWGKVFRVSNGNTDPRDEATNPAKPIDWIGWTAFPPAASGTITMTAIPFLMINSTGISGRLTWCGVFPNVRKCSMEGLAPGDEIVYGAETWKVFPILRNTTNSILNTANTVTSGRCGIAFKKV